MRSFMCKATELEDATWSSEVEELMSDARLSGLSLISMLELIPATTHTPCRSLK